MVSKVDELPVVWFVVSLDDPPSMNDVCLTKIDFDCCNDELNGYMAFSECRATI
jgi:hypothetical protein